MREFFVLDNFFEDPDEVRKRALNYFRFYDASDHPDPDHLLQFPGLRTNYINLQDTELSQMIIEKQAAITNFITNNRVDWSHEDSRVWNTFSLTFKNINKQLPQWHQDFIGENDNKCEHYYAGVVYLNKNVRKGRGTKIELSSGEIVNIENKYNRFVIYNSKLRHTIAKSFGWNKDNGRLVMSQFFSFNLKK